MVILPVEKSLDWRRKPLVLMLLILINTLVYVLFQWPAEQRTSAVIYQYVDSGLQEMEWRGYQSYLLRHDEALLQSSLELYDNDDLYMLAHQQLSDDAFLPWLQDNTHLLDVDDEELSQWRYQRTDIDVMFQPAMTMNYGLDPSDISPLTLITHQFLHGDLFHLLGNMVFLLFCGFAVEGAMGAGLFLLLYLLSGVVGGLLYALVEGPDSHIVLIGASGSISGVMAMYLGVFRLRKIEFFYWFYLIAGYFRAPALLILPFYIGKEVFSYITDEGAGIAYMAHAGGFVAGGVMTVALLAWKPALFNQRYIEEDQKTDPLQAARTRIAEDMAAMKFQQAEKKLQQLASSNQLDSGLMKLRLQLAKLLGSDDVGARLAELMLIRDMEEQMLPGLVQLWNDNRAYHAAIDAETRVRIGMRLAHPSFISCAEEIFESLYRPGQSSASLQVLARNLSRIAGEAGQKDKQARYLTIANASREGMLS